MRIKSPFKHYHKWETTHTNRYMFATRQVCKCGAFRETTVKGTPPLTFKWVYSDGGESDPISFLDGEF